MSTDVSQINTDKIAPPQMNDRFIFKEEGYKIIGACMEVHNELGFGFLEAVYQEALMLEFIKQGIPFEREKKLKLHYKDETLEKYYRPDFLCYDKIIIELKTCGELSPYNSAQLLNYLKATSLQVGYLINFGTSRLQYKRIIK